MFSKNLAETILFSPISSGADSINILSGIATPTMASWYLTSLHEKRSESPFAPLQVNLIVGMTSADGVSFSSHSEFQDLQRRDAADASWDTFSCSYVYDLPAIHSNLYVWTKKGEPVSAYTGSAHFLQSSFLPSEVEDLMLEADPVESLAYYQNAEDHSMFCTHSEIESNVRIVNDFPPDLGQCDSPSNLETIALSLLTRDGGIGSRSGLNWGQREGRNPNEAYIPVPRKVAQTGFFPLDKQQFTVQTDDHKSLILRIEQENDKALATPLSNSLLGEYFRRRLGLSNGEFVSVESLKEYGRTNVSFTKIDEEQYYMDFSQPVK
ncbi:restriction endonuclease PLD domain-containing protein [Bifidobacterium moukalabense]|uniref:restriction endonuclease PLD domain-containing protein n=1 Tax=Bifidobacterium moukalabense TaxID=1333651 RepID=UPI0010F8CF6F|nr:restriction endonuclease PLD domain-containing protein [Bifidobacterium moukalabense]